MVLASNPVASVMRLAARPVGAHSRISVRAASSSATQFTKYRQQATAQPFVVSPSLREATPTVDFCVDARPMAKTLNNKAKTGACRAFVIGRSG
jgi:hypothetical protein